MHTKKRLVDAYRFSGFTPDPVVHGVFGDRHALVIKLKRREKKQSAHFALADRRASTTGNSTGCGISRQAIRACTWSSNAGVCSVRGVKK